MTTFPRTVLDEVERTREVVARLHAELPRWGLVVWTAGNVSQRVLVDPDSGPGPRRPARHQALGRDLRRADARVDGRLRPRREPGRRRPRRRRPTPRRTPTCTGTCPRWAGSCTRTRPTRRPGRPAREPIPCVLTMMADEFGGDIPVGPFALIGDDSIGRGIVETLRGSRSPAVLMRNHGPFTVGRDASRRRQGRRDGRGGRADRAHRAPARPDRADRPGRHRLALRPLPARLRADPRRRTVHDQAVRRPRDLVPHREPGPLRRGHAAAGGRAVAGDRPGPGRAAAGDARLEARADELRRDPAHRARGQRRRLRHRRDHLDAHVLPGQDVDRRVSTRCARRCCTCTRRRTSSCRGTRSTSTS